ncbi:MAG: energy-coupling factor transporter transmembrane protein EcfT [Spirochaetaceae bacterium]|nr:energy-coupling factor transporter transmembrane protein EcfT [Spirochaetaceae bacterium]
MSGIEYSKNESFLHRLDPRTKLLSLLLLTLVVFIVNRPFVIAAIMFTLIALWFAAGMPFAKLKSYIKVLFWLIIFITLVQMIFGPGTNYIVKPLIPKGAPLIGGRGSLKWEGIFLGLLIGLRLVTLMMLTPMLTMTTKVHILALGLTRLGMHYKGAYITTAAINLLPVFEEDARAIMEAQKLRGLRAFEEGTFFDKLRAYPAIALPLIIGAMRRAQMMGAAMDARAFGAYPVKNSLETIKMSFRDYIAFVAVILCSVSALVLNCLLP